MRLKITFAKSEWPFTKVETSILIVSLNPGEIWTNNSSQQVVSIEVME